jgi:hypothetical protein
LEEILQLDPDGRADDPHHLVLVRQASAFREGRPEVHRNSELLQEPFRIRRRGSGPEEELHGILPQDPRDGIDVGDRELDAAAEQGSEITLAHAEPALDFALRQVCVPDKFLQYDQQPAGFLFAQHVHDENSTRNPILIPRRSAGFHKALS